MELSAGSGAFVWSIGRLGARLLNLLHGPRQAVERRQQEIEPLTAFLEHTLAVAEVRTPPA